jgi:hypothetical protein
MNAATNTARPDLATLTARIKAAHAARMARLAPAGTVPHVGQTVIEGNFEQKAEVLAVDGKYVRVRAEGGNVIALFAEQFNTTIRPWRVLVG